MMKFERVFATAILSGALVLGSGISMAAAHHGDPSGHSTTKGKTLSAIEIKERQITAELNRKQLQDPQVAMVAPAPMIDEMPQAMPAMQDEAASLMDDLPELAAIEEDGAAN